VPNLGNAENGISEIAEDTVFLETAKAFLGLSRIAIAPSRGLGPALRIIARPLPRQNKSADRE
jgi:hypothetical protein